MTEGIEALVRCVRAGDRRALARAITLVESTRPADRDRADKLLEALLPATGQSLRIGVSGAPGAGKSTFIEALGELMAGQGKKLAVLAVDPSSRRSGGSILGDKTRMSALGRNPLAFIRPTASGNSAGGVARRTREAILLAEAAGHEVVLVETVGVGQSETAVSEMVDVFVLLIAPGSGDDLQGIKRGVMELADVVLITKADGDLLGPASRALADYRAALALVRPKYPGLPVKISKTSAMRGSGIPEAWETLEEIARRLRTAGTLDRLRSEQARNWYWSEVRAALAEAVEAEPQLAVEALALEGAVISRRILPEAAARNLIRAFRRVDAGRGSP